MKELLEKLAKGETTVDEVLAAIEDSKKDMVPRTRLNDKNDEIKELKDEIKQRDTQITELEKSAKGNDDLLKQLDDLKSANDGWQQKYNETQLNNAIKLAVAKEAKDANDILFFIKKDGLEVQEDGAVKGLEETLKTLKESKPYLFAEEQPTLGGRKPNVDGSNPNPSNIKNPFTAEHFNLTEQARLFKEDPELYKQLQAQATK